MARAQRRNSSRPSQASQPGCLSWKSSGVTLAKEKKNLINFSLHTAAVGTILPLLNYKLWVQNGRKAEKFSSRFWLVPGTSFCASVVRAFNGPPEVMSDFLVSSFICTRTAITLYLWGSDRLSLAVFVVRKLARKHRWLILFSLRRRFELTFDFFQPVTARLLNQFLCGPKEEGSWPSCK